MKRSLIDPHHPELSIVRQCELLKLPRSTYYYNPSSESAENLELMRLMDRLFMERPTRGSRQLVDALARQHGLTVNRKRVIRLMQLMGIRSVLPQPGSSQRAPAHKLYPYLLRDVKIERVNQVWSSDITYIPVRGGWVYLVAVIDWYSRLILSWELSNSMEIHFCLIALERALHKAQPEIFNTDQGAQFTSPQFVEPLQTRGIRVSMDGKGRCLDNVWIERFWRTLKYEEVYLREYSSPFEAWQGIRDYIQYYNHERAHQSLNHATPAEVYFESQVATPMAI